MRFLVFIFFIYSMQAWAPIKIIPENNYKKLSDAEYLIEDVGNLAIE